MSLGHLIRMQPNGFPENVDLWEIKKQGGGITYRQYPIWPWEAQDVERRIPGLHRCHGLLDPDQWQKIDGWMIEFEGTKPASSLKQETLPHTKTRTNRGTCQIPTVPTGPHSPLCIQRESKQQFKAAKHRMRVIRKPTKTRVSFFLHPLSWFYWQNNRLHNNST